MNSKNEIYLTQFLLISLVSIVTFKIAMLPKYLIEIAGNSAYISMAIMVGVEIMMLFIINASNKEYCLQKMPIPVSIKAFLLSLVFLSSIFKLGVLMNEGVNYVQKDVFFDANYVYIITPLIIVTLYLAHKGMKTIARLTEIIIWVVVIVVLFSVLLAKINLNLTNIKDSRLDSTVFVACDKYLIWFGDFTPLLLVKVNKKKSNNHLTILSIISIVIFPILLMMLFICIFGKSGVIVDNVFSKIAIYNQISYMVGTFNILSVIAFILCMTIKLSLLVFAIVTILKYFIKEKLYVTITAGGIILVYLFLIIRNFERSVSIAVQKYRYVFSLIEYLVPMVSYICLRIFTKKKPVLSKVNYDEI